MQNDVNQKILYKSYNHIFIIIFIGLAVSFGGFIHALENYNKELDADFKSFAKFQTEILESTLDTLFIKMKLIEQLYYASKNLEGKEYSNLISTISREGLFEAFLVLTPAPKDDYKVTYFAGRLDPALLESNIPFLKNQIDIKKAMDVTSTLSIPGVTSPYVAFTLLMGAKNNHKRNILVGLINLEHLFTTRVALVSNAKLLRAFIYETNNHSTPFYILDELTKENFRFQRDKDAYSLHKLQARESIYYQQTVWAGEQSWTVLLIPTPQYQLASYAIFPWIILISGLIIVSLLGYYTFKLTKTINQLHIRSVALIENKRFLQNIINFAVDGLITINGNGKIENFNPTCQKIFGYPAEKIINKNIIFLIPELNKRELTKYLGNLSSDENSTTISKRKEVTGKRNDNTTFPLDISFSKIEMGGRKIFNGIIRDITDRKEAEEMKEKLIHKLTESNIELEQFAYVASHDLQEPLRTITSYTSLITSVYKDNLDPELYKYISICTSAAKRMHELVSDLLEYASLEKNNTQFHPVDCKEVIKSVIVNLSANIKERKAEIKYGSLPTVWGTNILLISLFQNLINNGLKYQPENHTPKITIASKDMGDCYLISITDNGLGIEKKYLEKIFIPFKRLHTKHDFPGSGIGLAMCKRIVNKCKGKIWVESTLGKGSTFYFTLLKGDPLKKAK